jgi:hypothetical protein
MWVHRYGRTTYLLLLLSAVALGCGDEGTNPEGMSEEARAYLNRALDIMEDHSIWRYEIDWVPFREAAMQRAPDAQRASDTYDAIRYALSALGDDQGHLFTPSQVGRSAKAPPIRPSATVLSMDPSDPVGIRMGPGVGYIKMPAFSSVGEGGGDPVFHGMAYHNLINVLDTAGLCGWIVDLRENAGGNMWPMLAGIGPILGEGTVGMFVTPDSVKTPWSYSDGTAWLGENAAVNVPWPSYYELISPDPSVSVITGPQTANSGEAILVSFLGRPNTRTFGEATFGVPTVSSGFTLSDGAQIFLTVAWMADRSGRIYQTSIPPDVLVPGNPTQDPSTDPVLNAAQAWIIRSGPCGADPES